MRTLERDFKHMRFIGSRFIARRLLFKFIMSEIMFYVKTEVYAW